MVEKDVNKIFNHILVDKINVSDKKNRLKSLKPKLPLMTIHIGTLKAIAKNQKTGETRRKLSILERDNFRCVTCGATENLTFAHIIPKRMIKKLQLMDYTLDNCKTQCVKCHLKEEFGIDL